MKKTLKLASVSVTNILMSFAIQWYVIFNVGPGLETDAYFAGMALPQLLLTVISTSLIHVLIPMMSGRSEQTLRKEAWQFVYLVALVFGCITVVLTVFSFIWVPILFPGFDEQAAQLTIQLTQIQLAGMLLSAINGVMLAAHHANESFLWPELSILLANIVALLALIWFLPEYGIKVAAYISTLKFFAQTILTCPVLGRPVRPNFGNENIRQAWNSLKPLLWGTTYYKTDPLIDRFLLSSSISGSLSLYYQTQQVYNAIHQVLNKSIVAPLVPCLSVFYKNREHQKLKCTYERKLLQVGMFLWLSFICFAILGWIVISSQSLSIGKFDSNDFTQLWWLFIWLAGMYIGGGLGLVTSSTYYACGNTYTPTRISVLSFTIYVPFKIIAFYTYGLPGLALVTSGYYIVNLLLQIYLLNKSTNQ